MKLADLIPRRIELLGPMPPPSRQPTEAQVRANTARRKAQIGKPKAANRVQR